MYVQDWTTSVVISLQDLWASFASFVPHLIGAVIVFIIGLIVATGLGTLVEKIFDAVKLDTFLVHLGLTPYFERAGLRPKGARFLGQLVYWFIVIAFLRAASDGLGLNALSDFLHSVVAYMPNVIAAVLIMLASVVLANFLKRIVSASVLSAQLHAAHFLGTLSWWSVVILGFLAMLQQLQVAVAIVNIIVTGFIAMLALAGGLAFGLGGREYAAYLLGKLRNHTESR